MIYSLRNQLLSFIEFFNGNKKQTIIPNPSNVTEFIAIEKLMYVPAILPIKK